MMPYYEYALQLSGCTTGASYAWGSIGQGEAADSSVVCVYP